MYYVKIGPSSYDDREIFIRMMNLFNLNPNLANKFSMAYDNKITKDIAQSYRWESRENLDGLKNKIFVVSSISNLIMSSKNKRLVACSADENGTYNRYTYIIPKDDSNEFEMVDYLPTIPSYKLNNYQMHFLLNYYKDYYVPICTKAFIPYFI